MQLIKNFCKVLVTALLVTSATAELTKVPRVVDVETNALDKRARITVDQGTVNSATAADELYTEGLSTCIGAAAVGTANQNGGTDKILAHVSASNPENGDFNTQFDRWEQAIRDSQMTDVRLFLSVPRPDVVPAACRAMSDIIDKAKSTCTDLGIGCVTLERRNEDVTGAPPLGTVLIRANKDVEMEGRRVS
ncbi:hypothetical protein PG993_014172 [Apiospora rasikravindrae]|uniref:Uncharacterized protein n=1 Tax=Apiospora rasikravindrae TaxID=990691 RepID=A0ABR1RS99_9PEZI